MYNYQQQLQIIAFHNQFHTAQDPTQLDQAAFTARPDYSCIRCYQPAQLEACRQEFETFWNWFTLNSSAQTYSRITTEVFDQYLFARTVLPHNNNDAYIDRILRSIRFQRPEDRDTLVTLINNVAQFTRNFT